MGLNVSATTDPDTLHKTYRVGIEVPPAYQRKGEKFISGIVGAKVASGWLDVAGKAFGLFVGGSVWLWVCVYVLDERKALRLRRDGCSVHR
jgi:hypothetical protein